MRLLKGKKPQGSPPLAREQLFLYFFLRHTRRITPARAGTTHTIFQKISFFKDHPRSRGNNAYCQRSFPASLWITPARAGTTPVCLFVPCEIRDHPRSRGNNLRLSVHLVNDVGSPPLAREQRKRNRQNHTGIRITPARAGTTRPRRQLLRRPEDHPRSRGNNHEIQTVAGRHSGSPPLAREQLPVSEEFVFHTRITPARAGTTRK